MRYQMILRDFFPQDIAQVHQCLGCCTFRHLTK